jgi:osmotically-inducible protein OsmY
MATPAPGGGGSPQPLDNEARDAHRQGVIWASYVLNPVLQSYRIDVDVSGDTATLHGTVDSHVERQLAERIARRAEGIQTVENNIEVDPALTVAVVDLTPLYARHVADATVEAMVSSKLLWNKQTNAMQIDVDAERGVVTLTGRIDTHATRVRAGVLAADTPGVAEVRNMLRVDPAYGQVATPGADLPEQLGDRWLAERVRSGFSHSGAFDAADIDVSVRDGVVELDGRVGSDTQREIAIELAASVRGVRNVDASRLDVSQRPVAFGDDDDR